MWNGFLKSKTLDELVHHYIFEKHELRASNMAQRYIQVPGNRQKDEKSSAEKDRAAIQKNIYN